MKIPYLLAGFNANIRNIGMFGIYFNQIQWNNQLWSLFEQKQKDKKVSEHVGLTNWLAIKVVMHDWYPVRSSIKRDQQLADYVV